MNDDTTFGDESDPQEQSELETEKLRAIAQSVTTDDFVREVPPTEIWESIRAATIDSNVTSIGARSWSSRVLAAAAALAVIGAIGFGLNRQLGSTPNVEVAAEVNLVNNGLPVASAATAAVELLRNDDGYQLDVDLSAVPNSDDAVLEIWIIDEQVDGMFSLGIIDGDGVFDLPPGIEPSEFPIVDISVEPLDGDPTHSGQSVLRGVLGL